MRRFYGFTLVDFFVVGLLMRATTFEQIIERSHHSNAHAIIVQRYVPEPAFAILQLQDTRRPFVLVRISR